MPSDLLSARSVLPMTDAEIVRLYAEATSPQPKSWRKAQQEKSSIQITKSIDAFLYVGAAIWYLVSSQEPTPAQFAANVIFFVITVAVATGLTFSRLKVIGVISLVRHIDSSTPNLPENKMVPTTEMLSTVVDYITRVPVASHRALISRISLDQADIERSTSALRKIVASLNKDLADEKNEEVSILVSSRLHTAGQCISKLESLSGELTKQKEQAEVAIKPVLDMKSKFAYLTKVSDDLNAIQKAHGLALEIEGQMIENGAQLQLLQNASYVAFNQLTEIESIVESKELARAEVAELSL